MLLTLLALAVAIPATADIPPLRRTPAIRHVVDRNIELGSKGKTKGAWYMSAEGHAVYCYGPTMFINAGGGVQKVATFCRGDKVIVPLHD